MSVGDLNLTLAGSVLSGNWRQLRAVSLLALVHSGEGRDVMTRPPGPLMVSSSLASPVMVHPSECTR